MATYVKYQLATEKMVEGGNMGSDTWQMILSNTAPTVATDTTAASATELSTSGGYTAGGINPVGAGDVGGCRRIHAFGARRNTDVCQHDGHGRQADKRHQQHRMDGKHWKRSVCNAG